MGRRRGGHVLLLSGLGLAALGRYMAVVPGTAARRNMRGIVISLDRLRRLRGKYDPPLSLGHFPLFGAATDLPSLRAVARSRASGAGPTVCLMGWPRPTVRLEARTGPSCPA